VYPQLAARYLVHAVHVAPGERQALLEATVSVVIVAFVCFLNLLGLSVVAWTQAIAFALSLVPCLLFSGIGLGDIRLDHLSSSSGATDYTLLLSWAIWLYSGFSSLGAMAGEVEHPRRTYPAVVALLLPLVTVLNVVPFAVALSLDADRAHYSAGYFAALAAQLAGPWLRSLFIAGANISLLGLYHSQILAAERSLQALGEQTLAIHHGWCPSPWLSAPLLDDAPPHNHHGGRPADSEDAVGATPGDFQPPAVEEVPTSNKHPFPPPPPPPPPPPHHHHQQQPDRQSPRQQGPSSAAPPPPLPPAQPLRRRIRRWFLGSPSGGGAVPRLVILFNALGAAALTQLLHYTSLVEVEMMLYACSHTLFLYAFVALRWQRPAAPRPFRVPGGMCVACLSSAVPLLVCAAVVGVNMQQPEHAVAFGGTLAIGAAAHLLCSAIRVHRRGGGSAAPISGDVVAPYEAVP
jgi:amino acid transporter